ncbi:pentapeptide repeat-containing protein [Paenibacillus andongensis]|uniref:pentapeptide repeat-containing protein n=1 Tax=Paenibacillus andongensis TaxID=2975482 RepID=UPI0021BB1593|nr:pentapeptide repeat-containing protein [Paenibacillus andongensis]
MTILKIHNERMFAVPLTEKKVLDSNNGLELQDLRNEEINKVCFKGATFKYNDLRDTSIAHSNFVNSKWNHIYFSNVTIDMIQMGGTIFEKIVRPSAEKSHLLEEPGTDNWVNVEPVIFKNSDLSTAIFDSCNLTNVELKNCNINGLSIDGVLIKDLLEQYNKNLN